MVSSQSLFTVINKIKTHIKKLSSFNYCALVILNKALSAMIFIGFGEIIFFYLFQSPFNNLKNNFTVSNIS